MGKYMYIKGVFGMNFIVGNPRSIALHCATFIYVAQCSAIERGFPTMYEFMKDGYVHVYYKLHWLVKIFMK